MLAFRVITLLELFSCVMYIGLAYFPMHSAEIKMINQPVKIKCNLPKTVDEAVTRIMEIVGKEKRDSFAIGSRDEIVGYFNDPACPAFEEINCWINSDNPAFFANVIGLNNAPRSYTLSKLAWEAKYKLMQQGLMVTDRPNSSGDNRFSAQYVRAVDSLGDILLVDVAKGEPQCAAGGWLRLRYLTKIVPNIDTTQAAHSEVQKVL